MSFQRLALYRVARDRNSYWTPRQSHTHTRRFACTIKQGAQNSDAVTTQILTCAAAVQVRDVAVWAWYICVRYRRRYRQNARVDDVCTCVMISLIAATVEASVWLTEDRSLDDTNVLYCSV